MYISAGTRALSISFKKWWNTHQIIIRRGGGGVGDSVGLFWRGHACGKNKQFRCELLNMKAG